MIEILVVFLVIGLIVLTAFAGFIIGVYAATKNNIERLNYPIFLAIKAIEEGLLEVQG